MNVIDTVIHYGIGILLACMCYFFSGCSVASERIIYVPEPCTITSPTPPINKGNAYLNTLEILKYTELLEISLNACKGV